MVGKDLKALPENLIVNTVENVTIINKNNLQVDIEMIGFEHSLILDQVD